MSGPLIETSARTILNQGINEGIKQGIKQGRNQGISQNQKETALRMLQDGELSIDKIAKYSGLKVEDVEQLAELQTV